MGDDIIGIRFLNGNLNGNGSHRNNTRVSNSGNSFIRQSKSDQEQSHRRGNSGGKWNRRRDCDND